MMEQLKMYHPAPQSAAAPELPEGYSVSRYEIPADRAAWCECCKNGLIADDAGEAAFEEAIEKIAEIDPSRDVFFLDDRGAHIGTVTAYVKPDGTGMVHMVGLRTQYRGKHLGRLLVRIALEHLAARQASRAALTTDDWRKTAIRSYLSEGFLPVEYDIGMQDRWELLLEELGVEQTTLLYEDGSVFQTIYRRSRAPKIRFGVLGAGRGKSMMDYCTKSGSAELVAVCDKSPELLEEARRIYGTDRSIAFYEDFEQFLSHDMDCVVLANYANEHAPYAIRCLEAGKHVLSEVLPVQTLKQAVELIEAVNRTGRVYAYAENYCYMPAVTRLKKYYERGSLGEFEYGEGEYMHNCESQWHKLTWADPNHWRNTMSAFYYCTHSVGPLLHVTGLRPVRVTGFEGSFNPRMQRMGAKAGAYAVEMIQLENGAYLKSVHGVGPSRNSIWYSAYGSRGRMETAREDTMKGDITTLYTNCDNREFDNWWCPGQADTTDALSAQAEGFGHGGSDYYVMHHMVQKLRGNRNADIIDVYQAMDMFLPGMLGYRSVLHGGIPMDIPDLRDSAVREALRGDTACTDPAVAGDMLLPSYSRGNPDIPEAVYENLAFIPADQENNRAYWQKRRSQQG